MMSMAATFNEQTKIIHANPSISDDLIYKKRRQWLLLPVIAFKVYVPSIVNRPLNLFEETILKLLRISYKTPEVIADQLLLTPDLVKFVMDDMQEKGYVNNYYGITEFGESVLKNDTEIEEHVDGYIFYDPMRDQFWDAFIESSKMPYIQGDFELHGSRRTIELGTLAKPFPRNAIQFECRVTKEPTPPSNLKILHVLNSYKKRLRFEKFLSNGKCMDLLPEKLQSVKYLEEFFPLYVTSFVYLPKEFTKERHIKVCHPFGKHPSSELIEVLLDDRKQKPSVKKALEKFVDSLTANKAGIDKQEEMDKQEADTYFNQLFTLKGASSHAFIDEEIFDLLFDYFQTYKRLKSTLQQQSNDGTISGKEQSEISQFTVQGTQIFEAVLAKLVPDTQHFDYSKYLRDNKVKNAKVLTKIANSIGFVETRIEDDDFFETFSKQDNVQFHNTFERFFHVGIGHVAHAKKNTELRPLVALHLLMANDDGDHPFHQISKQMPRFILKLDQLQQKRNSFAHITKRQSYIKSVDELFGFTLRIAAVLYKHEINDNVLFELSNYNSASQFINERAYADSRFYIDVKFPTKLRQYKSLYNSLVDVDYYAKYPSNQYILECTSAIEALLNELLKISYLPNKIEIPDTTEQLLEKLGPEVQKFGFEFTLNSLPISFKKAQINRFRRSQMILEGLEKEVISTKVLALLCSVTAREQYHFEQLTNKCPDFFVQVLTLSDIRGHGKRKLPPAECKELRDKVFTLYENVFSVLSNKE